MIGQLRPMLLDNPVLCSLLASLPRRTSTSKATVPLAPLLTEHGVTPDQFADVCRTLRTCGVGVHRLKGQVWIECSPTHEAIIAECFRLNEFVLPAKV